MLKRNTFQFFFLTILTNLILLNFLQAQIGCPGCLVDVPNNLAADTIYLDSFPDATAFAAYDQDVSFRLPKTTTPVAANDPTVIAGITLDEISIIQITNLPPGIEWETNAASYFPDTQTDGCVRLCGTPLASGTFLLDVILEVRIGFFTQETSFQREMVVLPSSIINDGFTMTNGSGCGEVTVSFQNNVPSNGNSGYSYNWDFGNGNTSNNENPTTQTYFTPGVYPVDYQAVIDTSGYTLTKVTIIDADCTDLTNGPDFYLDIIDPNGNSFVTPSFSNPGTPFDFNLNIPLLPGNYTLVVKDEDSGINGTDDECDFYSFNQLSNGILINGSSSIQLTILHPVDTITTTDSVYVFPVPSQPIINFETPMTWCEDETIILSSSYPNNNQWVVDSTPIFGATDPTWLVQGSGNYAVTYTNDFGCTATSDVLEIMLDPLPEIPIFNNDNNLLEVVVPSILPDDYSLQWFYENTLLPGETDLSYCLTQTGSVSLEVTDNVTGCTNVFTSSQTFDPDFNCGISSIDEIVNSTFNVYPNPFRENIFIEFSIDESTTFQINVIDMLGRKTILDSENQFQGIFNRSYSFDQFTAGVYWLECDFGEYRLHRKIVLQK